jgi:hypothetical protein
MCDPGPARADLPLAWLRVRVHRQEM